MTVDLMIELDRAMERVRELAECAGVQIGWSIECIHRADLSKLLRTVGLCERCRANATRTLL